MAVTPGAVAPKRRGAAMAWIGVLIMLASLATFGYLAYRVVSGSGITKPFTAPVQQAPGTFSVTMDQGTYAVYQDVGASSSSETTRLVPEQITVTAESSATVPVTRPNGSQTVTRNGRTFEVVADWVIDAPGTYVVKVEAAKPTNIVIAPGLIAEFARVGIVGGLTFLACTLAGLIGLGLLIWGLVRRHRTRPVTASAYGYGTSMAGAAPPPTAGAVAAGWYPDPQRPGGSRYWDGRTWTDHRA